MKERKERCLLWKPQETLAEEFVVQILVARKNRQIWWFSPLAFAICAGFFLLNLVNLD